MPTSRATPFLSRAFSAFRFSPPISIVVTSHGRARKQLDHLVSLQAKLTRRHEDERRAGGAGDDGRAAAEEGLDDRHGVRERLARAGRRADEEVVAAEQ